MNHIRTILEPPDRDDEGFTLIELLVVVVILGILIAIAIPTYLNYRKSAADKSAQSDVRNAVTVLEACAVDGAYPTTVSAAGVMDATCSTQKMTVSENTTLAYYTTSDKSAYIVSGKNSGGSGKIYCYSSAAGGSVTTTATAVTAYRAAC